jgi:hypothetical protein
MPPAAVPTRKATADPRYRTPMSASPTSNARSIGVTSEGMRTLLQPRTRNAP